MSFDWRDYSKLSGVLIDSCKGSEIEEAYVRAAISRAYYAAYTIARKYLEDTGHGTFKGEGAHIAVIKMYEDYANDYESEKHADVAENLKRLRKYRRQSDYEDTLDLPSPINSAYFLASLAESTIESIDTIREESLPSE